MSLFNFFREGKKSKKKKELKEEDYNLENKLFPISKPWGYSPRHVAEAIKLYNETLEKQAETITKLKESLAKEKGKFERLDNEFRKLQIQLNFVSVPTMTDIQEDYIQKQFAEKFKNEPLENPNEETPKKSKIEILEDAAKDKEMPESPNPFGGRSDGIPDDNPITIDDIVLDSNNEVIDETIDDKAKIDSLEIVENKYEFDPFDIVSDPREVENNGKDVFSILDKEAKNEDSFDPSILLEDLVEEDGSEIIDRGLENRGDIKEDINSDLREEKSNEDFAKKYRF